MAYNISTDPSFDGSYAEKWLNDNSSEGFLENLYDYKNYVKEDSVWDYSIIQSGYIGLKPSKENITTKTVGMIDAYEYNMTSTGTTVTNPLQILPTTTLNNKAIIKSGKGLLNDPYILPTAKDLKEVTYAFTSTDNPTDVTLPEEETLLVGTNYTAKEVETTEGYTFDGWYTDESLTIKFLMGLK